MQINQDNALLFILRAMWKKQKEVSGLRLTFAEWLEENELAEKEQSKEKVSVRDNVKLSLSEISNLETYYTKEEISSFYDKLSNYKASRGKRYKSDYGAIQTWVIESVLEAKRKTPLHQHVKHWNEE